MPVSEFSLRLLCAFCAGFAIGFERQWHHKAAGLRTNTLVATGSALFVLLSFDVTQTTGDATRIIGQVVTGIGFLGAGIIFKEGVSVRGLTTAVTVWCSSAVGCIAASGNFVETAIATASILTINAMLMPIDHWLENRNKKSAKIKD